MELIAEATSQPTLPGFDLSWLVPLMSWPGVKLIVSIVVPAVVMMILWNKVLLPLVIQTLQSVGLIGKTWRQQTEADLKTVAKNTATLNKIVDPKSAVNEVPPEVVEDVKEIAGLGDTTIMPAITEKP